VIARRSDSAGPSINAGRLIPSLLRASREPQSNSYTDRAPNLQTFYPQISQILADFNDEFTHHPRRLKGVSPHSSHRILTLNASIRRNRAFDARTAVCRRCNFPPPPIRRSQHQVTAPAEILENVKSAVRLLSDMTPPFGHDGQRKKCVATRRCWSKHHDHKKCLARCAEGAKEARVR